MSAPEVVHRYYFSKGEVIAALFTNSPVCEFTEVAVVGDEVIVEFAGPKHETPEVVEQEPPSASSPPAAETDKKEAEIAAQKETPQQPPDISKGPIEQEALELCDDNLFRIFCQEQGSGNPAEFIRQKCKVTDLSLLDAGSAQKYAVSRFRDLSADFDVWARGD